MSMSISVLLVDDDPLVHEIFQTMLTHHGMSLLAVRTAEDALNCLEKYQPDLIVTDIFMFHENGFEVMRQIRQSKLAPDCPIVATTSYYSTFGVHEAFEHGFDAFLPKPFDAAMLVSYLEDIVQHWPIRY